MENRYKCPECNTPLNESMFCVKCCTKWTKSEPCKVEELKKEPFFCDVYEEFLNLLDEINKTQKEQSKKEIKEDPLIVNAHTKNGKIIVDSFENNKQKKDANYFIDQAKKHMADRAESYDNEEGERSMLSTVRAFSDITGICMTEEHGWLFMGVLKMVRSQQGKFKADNYEDGCAYFGLAGEAAAKNRA